MITIDARAIPGAPFGGEVQFIDPIDLPCECTGGAVRVARQYEPPEDRGFASGWGSFTYAVQCFGCGASWSPPLEKPSLIWVALP